MAQEADICLILEGTYPYVSGGVSGWTHELILSQPHLKFALISILPRDEADEPEMKYTLPENVISLQRLHLQRLPEGEKLGHAATEDLLEALRAPLESLTTGQSTLEDFATVVKHFQPYIDRLGQTALLDSEAAFALLSEMYEHDFAESSFLDYFWSWRAVLAGLFSLVSFPLPRAKVYHAVSTGYAGLLCARAKLETGKRAIITEHGIYTNERRIEIATAEWLTEGTSKALTISQTRVDLRDLWTATFANYSRIAYQAADEIITLFADNQRAQMADGAPREKLRVIPNGIDVERYALSKTAVASPPAVALIGRVVPVKDIKAFIRAVGILRDRLGDIDAYVIGPADEDPHYLKECEELVEYLRLEHQLTFTGKVDIRDYLPWLHLVVLSSISEAQPLVVLEAGASGTPVVSTDVGACREMLQGARHEDPPLGEGGIIVPPANPTALANGIYTLLTDKGRYAACAEALRQRVNTYYNKQDQLQSYRELYHAHLEKRSV
jgi:polysaccharide biosynthesis protein PelF